MELSVKPTVPANLQCSFQSVVTQLQLFAFSEHFFCVVLNLIGVEAWAEPSPGFIVGASIPILTDWKSAKDFSVLPSSFGQDSQFRRGESLGTFLYCLYLKIFPPLLCMVYIVWIINILLSR